MDKLYKPAWWLPNYVYYYACVCVCARVCVYTVSADGRHSLFVHPGWVLIIPRNRLIDHERTWLYSLHTEMRRAINQSINQSILTRNQMTRREGNPRDGRSMNGKCLEQLRTVTHSFRVLHDDPHAPDRSTVGDLDPVAAQI